MTLPLHIAYKKDIITFFTIVFLSVIFSYFMPNIISSIFFLSLLVYFWLSPKNHLWLVYTLLIITNPGNLFYQHGELTSPIFNVLILRLPLSFEEISIILFFIKALIKGKRPNLILKKPLLFLLIYFLILVVYSHGIGISFLTYKLILRSFIPYSLFYSIPSLIRKKEEYYVIVYISFVFVLVSAFAQVLKLVTGIGIENFSNKYTEGEMLVDEKKLVRYIYAPFLTLFCLFSSMFFLQLKEKIFTRNFLYLIIAISFFSMFITATRGWIISYTLMIILFIAIQKNKLVYAISVISLTILVALALILTMPTIKTQFDLVFERMETLELLIKGDNTAGGTLARISERGPRVYNKFLEHPIFGWGYSIEGFKYMDGHVGNQNMLLQVGIVGYFLFINFWIFFIRKVFKLKKRLNINNKYKNAIAIYFITFIGIFVIHSSSSQIFGTDLYISKLNKLIFLALFFSSFNMFHYESTILENKIIHNRADNPI